MMIYKNIAEIKRKGKGCKLIMYSYEIDNIIQSSSYNLDSESYINILKTSPQIRWTEYLAYEDMFTITTDDHYYWKFKVHRKEI